jgi:diguanylate cyclase (GGDEF)-like protein
MTEPKSAKFPMLALAVVGAGPALLAVYFAQGRWTIAAAAGAATATTGLFMMGLRGAREIALAENRERELQIAMTASEERITALVAKVRETSVHDDVTGTLNRRTFLARLNEVLQRDARLLKPMAFLLIDIDGFKKLNAAAGRSIGDRALQAVGRAIQASTRGTDFIGRIGGDEFAVVLGECVDPRPAVDRIFVALHGESIGTPGLPPLRVSVGTVTIPEPQKGVDPVHLLQLAEEALGKVRGGAGSRCAVREYRADAPSPVSAS